MARKRRQGDYTAAEVPMAPMIDVVFQLFIYFIMTMHPVDIFTHLNVSRPAEDRSPQAVPNINLLRINIYPHERYSLNEAPMTLAGMEKTLKKLADSDPKQTLLIVSSVKAQHEQLIKVLDLCSKVGLANLSILSAN